MIKGGTSAAGKCGNLRTGYTQQFIPCALYLLPEHLQTRLESNRQLNWNAYVEIENLTGDLIRVDDCSYFQVQKQYLNGVDTASITIEKTSLWSMWGGSYVDILRPSKRKIKVYAGFPGYEMEIYTGRITSVSETKGSDNLGAINLYCADYRSILQKIESTQTGYAATRYYEIYRLVIDTFGYAQQLVAITDRDIINDFLPVGNNLDAANNSMSGQPAWSMGAGVVTMGGNRGQVLLGNVLHINDDHINYAARNFSDASAYNVVMARGLDTEGDIIEQEVVDAVDIAKRGRVLYPETVGSDGDNLADMVLLSEQIIARSLAGTLSMNILFNPYLLPGQIVEMHSERFGIAKRNAKINAVRHQYSRGSCLTALDQVDFEI